MRWHVYASAQIIVGRRFLKTESDLRRGDAEGLVILNLLPRGARVRATTIFEFYGISNGPMMKGSTDQWDTAHDAVDTHRGAGEVIRVGDFNGNLGRPSESETHSQRVMQFLIDFDVICLVGQQPMVDRHKNLSSYRMHGKESNHHSTPDSICVSRSLFDARRQLHAVIEPKTLTLAESHNLVYADVPLY